MEGQLLADLVIASIAVGSAGTCAWLARALKRLRTEVEDRVAPLDRDLQALCASQRKVGDRLLEIEGETRLLLDGQVQLQMKAPSGGHYRQAIALVECGADPEQLVSRCGLAPGEADLVHRIHHQDLN